MDLDQSSLHEDDWEYVRTLLPADLEDSARLTQALRRCRNVPNAAELIRMALAYALTDLSLKDVAAWASSLNLAELTGPGLFYRLREAEVWLERVLGQLLAEQVPLETSGLPIRVVDATVVNGPGGRVAVQWRAHVLVSAVTGTIRSVQLTGDEGGEKLSRYIVKEGEVVLGDRAYGTARGLHAVSLQGAHVVVRFNPVTLRTYDGKRQRIYLQEREEQAPSLGAVEFPILIPVPPPPTKSHKPWDLAKAIAWIPARAVASRTRSGQVIWILTTLPKAVSALAVMGLYRLRWQIELVFKRLKSLLHLDTLPSRQGPTAKSWMLARFLAAALAQRLVEPNGPLSPWGYEIRSEQQQRSDQVSA
jgi:hypothetical protein